MGRLVGKICVMVSSSALFDMREENALWDKDPEAYIEMMHENQDAPLKPGACFELVKTMLSINKKAQQPIFEVIIVTKNSFAGSGIRMKESIIHHGFPAMASFFYDGDPIPMADHEALETDLLLTSCPIDAQNAVDAGIAAVVMKPRSGDYQSSDSLNIHFDFDGVIAGSDAEVVYKERGLEAYKEHEFENKNIKLSTGPFEKFIHRLKAVSDELRSIGLGSLININILTARAGKSGIRAQYHISSLGLDVKHARCLEGLPKAPFIKAHRPSLFVDDQDVHLKDSCLHAPCGQVLYPTGSPMWEYMKRLEAQQSAQQGVQQATTANDNKEKPKKAPAKITASVRRPFVGRCSKVHAFKARKPKR